MNKKRFTIFLSVLFCIILFPVLLLISKQPTKETSILTASNQEDIHQFYYRSVPGLEMAEEAGLVREVNRKLDWPGKSASIYIDHIWYNTKFVYLFYHAEGFPSAAYLGGDLFVPSSEPMEKQSFHGSASIGSSSERGILFNESYYSCLCLSPLKDRSGKLFSQLDMICFAPYINIPNPDKYEIIESTQLKSFEIPLNYHEEEENTVKYFFDKQLELEGKKLYFYQFNVSPSKLKLYFQYLNSGKDQVYRITGSYTTDKGESYSFDACPKLITEYPFHYTIEITPLHMLPEVLKLNIDSIYCIGRDEIAFEINTDEFTAKSRSWDTDIGKDRVKSTDITIKNIALNKHSVEVFIAYTADIETSADYQMNLIPMTPYWLREDNIPAYYGNQLLIQDGDYVQYNTDAYNYGADTLPGQGIRLRLDRQFWDTAEKVYIKLINLTYEYKINKSLDLKLSSDIPSG